MAPCALDVSELLADLRKLEGARRALERVLRLGQLAGLERFGQRVVGSGRERGEGEWLLLRRRDGREAEHDQTGREAEQSQGWCRLPHVESEQL